MDDIEHARQCRALARLEWFAWLLDASIRIPFTRFHLGLDPIMGLAPGVGDAAGLGVWAVETKPGTMKP